MGAAVVSESYDAEDLENGDAHKPNIIHGLKRRSSVTLKAIVRTFSLPGGKNIVRIPSPQQPQSSTLHEEDEEEESGCSATTTHERSLGCYSSAMSDDELKATEAAYQNEASPHMTVREDSFGSQVVPACREDRGHSSRSSTC